ncbi:MAG: CoA transferase [Minwuia sp.]|nr:CoA transferase [Minwuia sp.]
MAYTHVLDGIRVLDFTQFIAGPACTRLMAEMGADIIKLEHAPGGDLCRGLPVVKDGRSGYFVQHNQGKRSVCLDMRSAAGKAVIRDLIAWADLVVENFSPGVIDRLGFGWDAVHAINPSAIMCSISAFGQSGPLHHLVGFDYIAQAYAGVTSMVGDPDGPPPVVGLAIGDVGTAITALAAINGALFHRERTRVDGQAVGQFLDISLVDFYFHCHEINVQAHTLSKGEIQPNRTGRYHPLVAPIGVFKARDGYLMLVALGEQWNRVCAAMKRPDLVHDPRFVDNEARMKHQVELTAVIEDWLASLPSDAAGLAALEAARVPSAPVLSVADAVKHPHLVQRGTVRQINDRGLGEFSIPGSPFNFSAFPDVLPLTAPWLGEHNQSVLADVIGMSGREIDKLTADGILHAERR